MSGDTLTTLPRAIMPPRIGDGVAPAVIGTICLIVGGFIAIGGGVADAGIANAISGFGGLLIGVAFVVGLANKIERRLIDIQKEVSRIPD